MRMRWLLVSDTIMEPELSNRIPTGLCMIALVAGPPSPAKCVAPENVEMLFVDAVNFRIR